MFSLFQDDVNTLAASNDPFSDQHVPFTNHHELITAPIMAVAANRINGLESRIVFDAATAGVCGDRTKAGMTTAPPKQQQQQLQDAWCTQVLKLKSLHPSSSTKKNPTRPVPQFHSASSGTTHDAPTILPFQQFLSSDSSTRTLTSQQEAPTKAIPFQQFHSSRTLIPDSAQEILIPEEAVAHLTDLPEVRQVRFMGGAATEVVMPGDKSTDNDAVIGGGASQQHRRHTKRVYWSRNEVESMKRDAVECAKAFRTKRPATVSRLKQLFEDFCWKQSIDDNDYSADTEDDEEEEMLHRFLIDWGMSNVRGLEERVVPRRVFDQDRRMALESVLAYQQILRQTGVYSQAEMAAMLSTRSESASRRARMFAMYMALGDALAVAAFRSDEVYSDDASIVFGA